MTKKTKVTRAGIVGQVAAALQRAARGLHVDEYDGVLRDAAGLVLTRQRELDMPLQVVPARRPR